MSELSSLCNRSAKFIVIRTLVGTKSTGDDCRNDSALGLFNGDIGIALDRGQGTRVWFAMPDGNIKSVQPSRLPEHETTWAMTVHKSQDRSSTMRR